MIRETTYHETQGEAEAYGQAFCKTWGYGYGPTYSVGYSFGAWACYTYRYSSCD